MKKTVKKLLSLLLSAALLLTLLPAFAAEGPRAIADVFSAELFSDAAVNEFLKVFPRFASGIESALHSTPSDSPAYVELDPNGFSFSGDLYVRMNGDSDTVTFAEFFRTYGVNVYPQTLGAYLAESEFGDIAAALSAAGEWADFDTGDGPAFDFDWGLDGIDGLAEKYAAFTDVIALLIDAAGPMFALALGTQDLTLHFPGEMQFFKIVSPAIHVEYGTGFTIINQDLSDVVFYEIAGSAVFPSLGLYQAFVLPLYRALGVGTAIGYTFAPWNNNADADALAALLFDPLYALVSAVQNDPDARETLISFYSDGCEERVAQIGAGCTQKRGEITVSDGEVDFQVSGGLNYVQSAVKEALLFLFCEFGSAAFSIDVSAFVDAEGYRDRLNALLPALTVSPPVIVASGYCGAEGDGTNVRWTLTDDGTLTLTGTGAVAMHAFHGRNDIVNAVVEPGITTFLEGVFDDCGSLVHVSLPETLTSIGRLTFADCESLVSVDIPAGVTRIEEWTFANCAGLVSVSLPEGVTYIGDVAFSGCCALTGLNLPSALTFIGEMTFYNCHSLTSLTVPEGVTAVGRWAFGDCNTMTQIHLPRSLETIGGYAFASARQLDKIYFGGTEEEWDLIVKGENLYCDMPYLPLVYFIDGGHLCAAGDPVTENYEASSCAEPGHRDLVYYCRECGAELDRTAETLQIIPHVWGDWTILNYPTAAEEGLMERRCLRDDTHVETAAIPAGEFGEHELLRGYCGKEGDGKNLIWSLSDDGALTITGTGAMADYGWGEAPWLRGTGDEESIWMHHYGFDTDLQLYTAILNGEIDLEELFAVLTENDHPLRSVQIGEGVTTVGSYAFYSCLQLTEVSLPSTLKRIETEAFDSCESLTELDLPEGLEYIGPWAIVYTDIERITIPSTVTEVGYSAISGQYLSEITVMNPALTFDDLSGGMKLIGTGNETYPLNTIEDLKLYRELRELIRYYQDFPELESLFANERDALISELIEEFGFSEAEAPAAANRYYDFIVAYHVTGYGLICGVEFGSAAEAEAYFVGRINALLGTNLPAEELFGERGPDGNLTLLPAADEAFAQITGVSYNALHDARLYTCMLSDLSGSGCTPAPWVKLRVRCGSAWETDPRCAGIPLEIVEHDPALGEVITPSTCVTHGEATVTCPVCGRTFTGELPLGEHVPGEPVTENEVPATCTEPGSRDEVVTCVYCDYEFSRTQVTVPALGHDFFDIPAVAPTCTENGHTAYRMCARCAIWDPMPEILYATGHSHGAPVRENEIPAGCLTMGEYDTVIYCTDCGAEISREHVYEPALGHSFTSEITTPPTCTEPGVRTWTCIRCPESYTEAEPAPGHGTQGYNVSSAPSTCIVRGYSMTVCLACGEITAYETYGLDPDNHNWGEWTVITPATYLTEGLEQRTCAWCGETETNVLPVLVPEETISDPETGVELKLQEGVLPENTVFEVDEEFDGTYFMLLNRDLGHVDSTLYNITPVADGERVQPDGYVLVRLPIPAGYNPDTLCIYYISTETGTTERMDCYIENGYICFQTTHFSVYAIVDTSVSAQSGPTQPQTEDNDSGSVFARIANWFRSIIDFFKNLFKK